MQTKMIHKYTTGSAFPGTRFLPKNAGNFPSRALKTSHFQSHLIPAHSRLATSCPASVLKMKREFLYFKFCTSIPEIQCCKGIFLLGTENRNTKQDQGKNVLFGTEICNINKSIFVGFLKEVLFYFLKFFF